MLRGVDLKLIVYLKNFIAGQVPYGVLMIALGMFTAISAGCSERVAEVTLVEKKANTPGVKVEVEGDSGTDYTTSHRVGQVSGREAVITVVKTKRGKNIIQVSASESNEEGKSFVSIRSKVPVEVKVEGRIVRLNGKAHIGNLVSARLKSGKHALVVVIEKDE